MYEWLQVQCREKVRRHTVSEWKLLLSSHRYMLPFASHDEIYGDEPETQEDLYRGHKQAKDNRWQVHGGTQKKTVQTTTSIQRQTP